MTFIQNKGLTPEGGAVSIPVSGQFGYTNDLLNPNESVTLMWRDPEGNILGEWVPTDQFASLKYNIQSDQPGMFQIEYSQDAETVGFTPTGRPYNTNPRLFQAGLDPKLKFARLRFRNTGSVRQTSFTFEGRLSPGLIQPTVSSLNSELLPTNLGQVSASVLFNPNEDGTFSPAGLNLLANADNQTNGQQKTQIVNEEAILVRLENPPEAPVVNIDQMDVDTSSLAQDSTLTDGSQITKIDDTEPIRVQLPLETIVNAIIDPTEPLNVAGKVSIQEEGDEPIRVILETPITVNAPEVNVEAPIVNVPPTQITVQPASINYPDSFGIEGEVKLDDSTPIRVEVTNQDQVINVEAPIVNVPAPVVNVSPTPVTVEAPIVNVPAPVVNVAPAAVNIPEVQRSILVNGNNETVGNTTRPLTVNVANQPTTQQVSGTVTANVAFPATQQVSGSVNATIVGTPNVNATIVGSPSIEIANDQGNPIPVSGTVGISGTVPVSGTFFQATQPVSATALPLPTNASTSALQTSLNQAIGSPSDAAVLDPTATASLIALTKGLLQESIAPATTGTPQDITLAANVAQTIPANANRKGMIISSSNGTILIGVGYTATATRWSYRIVTNGMMDIPEHWATLSISLFSTTASTATATLIV